MLRKCVAFLVGYLPTSKSFCTNNTVLAQYNPNKKAPILGA